MMQAWWFLEDIFNKSAPTLLVNRKGPYQALSHMDSKVKSFTILLWLCFMALPLKMFIDLSKCSQQRTSPTRLKVCTYMAKSIGSIIMMLLIGNMCFACEVEGLEQE